ncbi:MAG: DUF763 domain-containing protein, partial [Candidatus Micrarchaeota archaeon]|nr:DUF763 domain-containing protein [Candidatus Micrarchaeota archaeon]
MHSSTLLPLHGGHAPRWLFGRMVKLSAAISNVIIDEFGPDELLRRLCDKDWFQALSCTIGYDWHSSGTTTVTMGALKQGLVQNSDIFIAGGKGKAGINTPQDIIQGTDMLSIPSNSDTFIQNSKLAAKIDSSLVYDNIGIYHHSFAFTKNRKWGVIQQAMSNSSSMAIRFQWFCDKIDQSDITNEPHTGVFSQTRKDTLDLTYESNKWAKSASLDLVKDPRSIIDNLAEGKKYQMTLAGDRSPCANSSEYPARHYIINSDITKIGWDAITRASELDTNDYRELLLVRGMGRATLRSLAFISSLIYGKELAYRDPVAYSYNVGGKDGIPFPVDRRTYDTVNREMQYILDSANID